MDYETRSNLRALLVRLYPGREEARRVASDAGLPTGRISFSGSAETFWCSVLEEAAKTPSGVDALRRVASREYPEKFTGAGAGQQASPLTRPSPGEQPLGSTPSAALGPAEAAGTGDGSVDFFVSYTARDERWAEWIAWVLVEQGYRCVFQKWDFRVGDDFVRRMHESINRAEKTIAVLSPDYLLSKYAMDEAFAALRVAKLLPVRVRACDPGGLLGNRVYAGLDNATSEEEASRRLLDGISKGPKVPRRRPPFPGPHAADRPVFPHEAESSKARAVVVAVEAELGRHATSVADRLRRMDWMGSVAVVDAARADGPTPDADLLVVLLGAQTGGSGTLARALERDAVVLKLGSLDLDSVDPAHAAEIPEALRLRKRATAAPAFSTPEDAAEVSAQAAVAWRHAHTTVHEAEASVLSDWEREYLLYRLPCWEKGTPGPLLSRGGASAPVDLARIYVPLQALPTTVYADAEKRVVVPPPGELGKPGRRIATDAELPEGTETRSPVVLDRALCAPELPHVVVEGEPGAGKTALLQHVAYVLGSVHTRGVEPPRHALDLATLRGSRFLLPVPVLLQASKLAECLATMDGLGGLLLALESEVEAALGARPERKELRAGLLAGRYLVLVDSLDEVPDEPGRRRVVEFLAGLAHRALPSRVVLTTRPSAYLGRVSLDEALPVVHVAPLDDETVAELARRWCAAHGCDDRYEHDLLAALTETASKHGANLAENPLLLTATLLVYARRQRLPDSTAELFESIVQTLFEARRTASRREHLELVLEQIQRHGGTELRRDLAAEGLHTLRPGEFPTVGAADRELEQLYNHTGLIRFESRQAEQGPAEHVVRPWHRSFQEYLTACRLASGTGSVNDETDRLFVETGGHPLVLDPAWEGVLGFLTGVYGEQGGSARAQAYIERLRDHAFGEHGAQRSERIGRVLGLAARGIVEEPDYFVNHPLRDRLRQDIVDEFAKNGPGWPLADRLLALEALGRLGDPRLDEDLWVDVPAGEFEMGGDSEAWNSAPAHRVRLDTFKIAWRPVTVQDFAAFVERAYNEQEWWTAGRADSDSGGPEEWDSQKLHPNRPVVGVSWYAAKAFCKWASAHAKFGIAPGSCIDLLAEAQWEYAARGPAGEVFPWGSDEPGEGDAARANYWFEGSTMAPTPVGAFPGGHRGRLVDLAGNVMEWCLDTWRDTWETSSTAVDNPCHVVDTPSSSRVVRGGSWSNGPGYLRCADRFRVVPGRRGRHLGFRVVCGCFREHFDV